MVSKKYGSYYGNTVRTFIKTKNWKFCWNARRNWYGCSGSGLMASLETMSGNKNHFVALCLYWTVQNLTYQPHLDPYLYNAIAPDHFLGRISKRLAEYWFLSIQSEATQHAASQTLIINLKELDMSSHQAVFNIRKRPCTHFRSQWNLLY